MDSGETPPMEIQISDDDELEAVLPGDTYEPLDPKFDPHVVGGFSTEISWADRQRLYKVIRKVHLNFLPEELCTEAEMDRLIDAWGPKVAQYEIMRHIQKRNIE